jgi:hypothetical protein
MIYRVFFSTRTAKDKNVKREKNVTVKMRAIKTGEERD